MSNMDEFIEKITNDVEKIYGNKRKNTKNSFNDVNKKSPTKNKKKDTNEVMNNLSPKKNNKKDTNEVMNNVSPKKKKDTRFSTKKNNEITEELIEKMIEDAKIPAKNKRSVTKKTLPIELPSNLLISDKEEIIDKNNEVSNKLLPIIPISVPKDLFKRDLSPSSKSKNIDYINANRSSRKSEKENLIDKNEIPRRRGRKMKNKKIIETDESNEENLYVEKNMLEQEPEVEKTKVSVPKRRRKQRKNNLDEQSLIPIKLPDYESTIDEFNKKLNIVLKRLEEKSMLKNEITTNNYKEYLMKRLDEKFKSWKTM